MKKKKLISKWWFWLIIVILLILAAYSVVSYFKPEMRFGFRNLLIDSRTHSYKQGEEFKYGPYLLTVNAEKKNIEYNPEDCSAYKDGSIYDQIHLNIYTKRECESDNNVKKTKSETHDYLSISFNVKNYTGGVHSMNEKYFTAIDNSGKSYLPIDVNFHEVSLDFNSNNILPGQNRSGKFNQILVEKNLKEMNFIITLPNSASQILNLNF